MKIGIVDIDHVLVIILGKDTKLKLMHTQGDGKSKRDQKGNLCHINILIVFKSRE